MAQLAVVLLALFAQMERTYTIERAARARSRQRRAGVWGGRCWSMRPRSSGRRICASRGTRSRRSFRRRASRARALPASPATAGATSDRGGSAVTVAVASDDTTCRNRLTTKRRWTAPDQERAGGCLGSVKRGFRTRASRTGLSRTRAGPVARACRLFRRRRLARQRRKMAVALVDVVRRV
jgi:hypothetical protein